MSSILHDEPKFKSLNVKNRAACKLVVSKLMDKVFQYRRKMVGDLLAAHRKLSANKITSKGNRQHCNYTEPYYYDAAYTITRNITHPIPISVIGKCMSLKIIPAKGHTNKICWGCTTECKELTDHEIECIVSVIEGFKQPIEIVREQLSKCDGNCPNIHFYHKQTNADDSNVLPRLGHPLTCYNDNGCNSQLRILRCAAVHYPLLSKILRSVYTALQKHDAIVSIDEALLNLDYLKLIKILNLGSCDEILANDLDYAYHQDFTDNSYNETKILLDNAASIADFNRQVYNFAEYTCISCQMLYKRHNVSQVDWSDPKLNCDIFNELKLYLRSTSKITSTETSYICKQCKTEIKSNELPSKCILKGLEVIPIPRELQCLDTLSLQLVQRAKCYQTIVRLGTYSGKVPNYNSLKGCKGMMFFLPLPMKKTWM